MALQALMLLLQLRAMPSSLNDACRTMEAAAERIEALEAALQKITDLIDSETGEPLDDAIEIARAALDKDDGK